jgi:transposase
MDEKNVGAQPERRVWVGLDWAKSSHVVSVVDERQVPLDSFKSGASLAELRVLAERLRGLGTVAGIAIEATPNPVLPFLVAEGFPVYPVNPKLSKHWREGASVAGVKSDARDSLVLATELARRHSTLDTFKQYKASTAELAGLCERLGDLVCQRTALVLRLEAALLAYHPAALAFFSDWARPAAWRFVRRFPTPQALAGARPDTIVRFLRANRIGITETWRERIARRTEAAEWPGPQNSLALQVAAEAAASGLLTLQAQIRRCERLVAERVKDEPKAELLGSLPGAGPRLAPALTAIVLLAEQEGDLLQALRCLSGVAPVQNESGKARPSQFRRRCNKHWRCVLHKFAHCSRQYCPWARAYYRLCRARGDGHGTAMRKLADKWLKIIHRMVKDEKEYDDDKYVQALRESGSPLYQELCQETCGEACG